MRRRSENAKMKMQFLKDGSPQCPLIRLFDFTANEACQLRDVILSLSANTSNVSVHDLPFVESVDDCHLTLEVGHRDQGIVRTSKALDFACCMTRGAWDNIAGLLEPIVDQGDGYQWLVTTANEARLLLSQTGKW